MGQTVPSTDPITALTPAAGRPWRRRTAARSHDVDFAALHAAFLISAVTTILVIRTDLWLTHYPQLGGHGLHIAHLLYGGALMAIAIGLTLTFVGARIRRVAAIVGGIGFGFFIDELGKFVTSDNNYFFKPAPALIYTLFIGLFLGARSLRRRTGLEAHDYLASALELLADAARRPLDTARRDRLLALLDRAAPDPLAATLRDAVVLRPVIAPPPPNRAERLWRRARSAQQRVTADPRWSRWLMRVIVAWAVLSALSVIELVLGVSLGLGTGHAIRGFRSDSLSTLTVVNILSLLTVAVTVGLSAIGIVDLRRGHRHAGLRRLEQGLLVAILLTRAFSFVESQFHAVFGLGVDLLLLIGLEGEITREAGSAEGR